MQSKTGNIIFQISSEDKGGGRDGLGWGGGEKERKKKEEPGAWLSRPEMLRAVLAAGHGHKCYTYFAYKLTHLKKMHTSLADAFSLLGK